MLSAEEQEEAISNSLPSILNFEQHLFDEFEEPQNAEDTDEDGDNDETEDNMLQNKFGLKHRCPFNSLQSFHDVFSCPPGRNLCHRICVESSKFDP